MVFALEQKCSKRPYSKAVMSDVFAGDYLILKAEHSDKIVGYAAAIVVFTQAEIINIVVDKDHQNKGIGKKLLENLVEHCRRSGATQVFLEVEESNHAAIKLYTNFGFRQIFIRKNYYGEFSAIIMEYIC